MCAFDEAPTPRKAFVVFPRLRFFFLLLGVTVGGLASAEESAPVAQNAFAESAVIRPVPITLEQATQQVRRAYQGRMLSVTPIEGGFRFRIDVEGRVKTVVVDDDGLRERAR